MNELDGNSDMTKNIFILILILILALATFLLFIKVNLDYQEINDMKGEQQNKDKIYLENASLLAARNNELENKLEQEAQNGRLEDKYVLYENLSKENYQIFKITGYSLNDPAQGTTNIVKADFNLDDKAARRLPIVAVDPAVVPLYSIVEIEGFGAFIALDTGGAIKGKHIEILFDSKKEAINFGVKKLKIRIIK